MPSKPQFDKQYHKPITHINCPPTNFHNPELVLTKDQNFSFFIHNLKKNTHFQRNYRLRAMDKLEIQSYWSTIIERNTKTETYLQVEKARVRVWSNSRRERESKEEDQRVNTVGL